MGNMQHWQRWMLRWLIWRELGRIHHQRRQQRRQSRRAPSHRLPLWRRFVILLLDVFLWLLTVVLHYRRPTAAAPAPHVQPTAPTAPAVGPQEEPQGPATPASAATKGPHSTVTGRRIEWC